MDSLQKAKAGLEGIIRPWWLNGWSGRLPTAGVAMLTLAGCVSLETAAPPVGTLAGGGAPGTLAAGRALYLGRCAKCHAVEPVRNYPAAEWAEILPDMAGRAKLTTAEAAEVQAYVWAVLRQSGG